MKRVVKWTTVLMVVLMAASGAWAWDEGFHVKKANDNKGDLLFVPGYFTSADGWETKLTVINTHPAYSVVAKVVYRSHYWTKELLDHLIYLSPRDVWVGTIKQVGGQVVINCKDDSMLAASNIFANQQEVNQPFYTANICANDSADRGYVEIIEVWFGDASLYPNPNGWDDTIPVVDKRLLVELYPPDGNPAPQPAGLLPNLIDDAELIDHTINVLTGFFEIQNPKIPGMTSALEMMVYSDFDVTQYMHVAEVSGLNAYTGRNTIGELEAAMSKDLIAMPYVNRTGEVAVHFFNFPTKMATDNTYCVYDSAEGDFWNQYFLPLPLDQCIDYQFPFFDLSENELTSDSLYSGGTSPTFKMCEELEWKFIQNSPYFAEGWVEYDFDNTWEAAFVGTTFEPARYVDGVDDFLYTGFPVQPFVLYVKNVGVNMFYPAWDDGMVYADGTADGADAGYLPDAYPVAGSYLYDYQSFNVMSPLGRNDDWGDDNSRELLAYPNADTNAGVVAIPAGGLFLIDDNTGAVPLLTHPLTTIAPRNRP